MGLIEQTSSSGRHRRCDARCYNGKKARCRCICGGSNHGVGLEKAIRNTFEMAQQQIRDLRRDPVEIAATAVAKVLAEKDDQASRPLTWSKRETTK